MTTVCLRLISVGDLRPGWNHTRNLYPQHIQQAGIEDRWKTAPVSFESCGDMQQWEDMGFDIKFIFDWGLDHHVSTFNNKSQIEDVFALPDNLAAGTYHLDAAILDVNTNILAIQLAIKGQVPDGWYAISEIEIE